MNKQTDYYTIEQRRYIGCKAKLTDWIFDIISQTAPNQKSFCDIFAGTGIVASKAIERFDSVIINDFLFSNNIIYKAFFGNGEFDMSKVLNFISDINDINPAVLEGNYFSDHFGGKYYDLPNAKKIGHIRQIIENRKHSFTDKEYYILLASLLYSIDKIANTLGHFDAYIKKSIPQRDLIIKPVAAHSYDKVTIYQEDSNVLARRIYADVMYIDPPYNSRQYSRFYHLYETLIKWDKPELFGVALKPKPENMSDYCTTKASHAFEDLIMSLQTKYIVVSYNNTYDSKSSSSENRISLDEITTILGKRGKTNIYEHSHPFFNAGKTSFNDHKEFLFVTKVL